MLLYLSGHDHSPSTWLIVRVRLWYVKDVQTCLRLPLGKCIERILRTARELRMIGFAIVFKWLPSHIGVAGTEAADKLARTALAFTTMKNAPQDIKGLTKQAVLDHFHSLWSTP